MYEDRGEMISTFIVCFALSSTVAGYTSGSYYRQYFNSSRADASSNWQKAMVYTILLFPSIMLVMCSILNAISVYYESISAIPITVLLKVFAIWAFVSLPLAVIGTIVGRHLTGKYEPPCRVNSIPRPIPNGAWYTKPSFIVMISGVLPFGSIFIEMYFIFTAFWSYKFYYVYGFVLLVYAILFLVTISTTIVSVYCVLNAENYQWQWTSLGCAASTAFYVFLYSVFYFFYKTQMTGLLQVCYYFGYMYVLPFLSVYSLLTLFVYRLLFCLALFLMCGAVGVWGASAFVHKIYRNVKID
jgi:transmembrane 9 superfamily protein 3